MARKNFSRQGIRFGHYWNRARHQDNSALYQYVSAALLVHGQYWDSSLESKPISLRNMLVRGPAAAPCSCPTHFNRGYHSFFEVASILLAWCGLPLRRGAGATTTVASQAHTLEPLALVGIGVPSGKRQTATARPRPVTSCGRSASCMSSSLSLASSAAASAFSLGFC